MEEAAKPATKVEKPSNHVVILKNFFIRSAFRSFAFWSCGG